MDEAELDRLASIAGENLKQNLEERITALREELEKKHQDEMTAMQSRYQQETITFLYRLEMFARNFAALRQYDHPRYVSPTL